MPRFGNLGFVSHPRLGTAYRSLAVLSLIAAAVIPFSASCILRIWRAGLPIRSTLLVGELFIWCINVGLVVVAEEARERAFEPATGAALQAFAQVAGRSEVRREHVVGMLGRAEVFGDGAAFELSIWT